MRKLILFSILAALLVAAPVAFAADSTTGGYGGTGGNTQVDIEPGGGAVGGETTAQNTNPATGDQPTSTDCVGSGGNAGPDGVSGTSDDCTEAKTASAGSLPFTGQDLGLISLVGAMFLLAGFGLRRLSRGQLS
jgi:hypothetical protein